MSERSACCDYEVFVTETEYICRACGAKKRRNMLSTIPRDPVALYKLALPVCAPDHGPVWVTREREEIPVWRMGDRHLLNTIRMLKGESPIGTHFNCTDEVRAAWIKVLAHEARTRGLKETDVLRLEDS